jgi:glycosyltransferase involved in cell wall biosynthesis
MGSAAHRKLLMFVTEDWYFWSHRRHLARQAVREGFEVVLVTRCGGYQERIQELGIRVVEVPVRRSIVNPFREIRVLVRLFEVYRKERPSVIHHVALKPVLYGSLVACLLRPKGLIVNAFAGMGYIFSSQDSRARLMRRVISSALVIFSRCLRPLIVVQNDDDYRLLVGMGIAKEDQLKVVRGVGVNLTEFSPVTEPSGTPVVMLLARLLADKGVVEFVEAARLLKAQHVKARFVLVGDVDPENPASVSEQSITEWERDGCIERWGRVENVAEVLALSNIVCLPSYREGLPKVLLEAAACGRAIVTTDVPGCREVVSNGVNGFVVPAKDPRALAEALRKLIEGEELRRKFGAEGRKLVEEEFSDERITEKTLNLYRR